MKFYGKKTELSIIKKDEIMEIQNYLHNQLVIEVKPLSNPILHGVPVVNCQRF